MLSTITKFVKKTFYSHSLPAANIVKGSNHVVLILGWGGSSASKNYGGLLRHYESKGISTVIHVMPLFCPKFIRDAFEHDIQKLVQLEQERHNKDHMKFNIHLFSQNGSWTYAQLMKKAMVPVPEKLIMDSAPYLVYERNIPFEAESLSKLVTSVVLNKAQYYQFPLTPLVKSALYVISSLSVVTDTLIPFKYDYFTNYIQMNKYLRDHSPVVPTMFIYSTGDKLVLPEGIRACKHHLEQNRGVPTSEHVFGEEVSHITGMYKRHAEYMRLVDQFFGLVPAIPAASAAPVSAATTSTSMRV